LVPGLPQSVSGRPPTENEIFVVVVGLLSHNIIVRSAAVIFPLKITRDVNNVFIFFYAFAPLYRLSSSGGGGAPFKRRLCRHPSARLFRVFVSVVVVVVDDI